LRIGGIQKFIKTLGFFLFANPDFPVRTEIEVGGLAAIVPKLREFDKANMPLIPFWILDCRFWIEEKLTG